MGLNPGALKDLRGSLQATKTAHFRLLWLFKNKSLTSSERALVDAELQRVRSSIKTLTQLLINDIEVRGSP